MFVKNLPTDCKENELVEVFSRLGEVVKCFTVGKRKNQEKEKGDNSIKYAFVTFSSEEGVNTVLSQKLVKLKQKRLICLAAKRRVRQRIKSKPSKVSDSKSKTESLESDSDSDSNSDSESDGEEIEIDDDSRTLEENKHTNIQSRSLVVSGLPSLPPDSQSEDTEKYRNKIQRRVGKFVPGLESVELLPQLEDKLLLTFSSKNLSRKAITLLNGKSWADRHLEVQLASLALLETSVKHQKKSKLLIRNLSFKCNLEELRKSFEEFGSVVEAHIPQKPGTDHMLGFGFVTMGNIFEASLALRKMNGCEIKGRKVAVDWALDRKVYLSQKQQSVTAVSKESDHSGNDAESDDLSLPSDEVASEVANESENSNSDSVAEETDSRPLSNSKAKVRPRRDDSTDGNCLFLRNLPFSFDEEELTSYFTEEFGQVKYAKLVTNRDTGMLTGNGFVRFIDKSTADECIQQSEDGVVIEGRTIEVMRAVTRVEASNFSETRKRKDPKKEDKRNLGMSHFGSIAPESDEFQELSKTDKDKRMRAENEKLEKLKNPNIFVSRDRLSLRNLALSTSDNELKELCAKHTPKGGKVKSARIMRDLNRLKDGIGRSKGFGFVDFSSHEAALHVLQSLNNNPDVLPNRRRLIVEFSLENQRAVRAKQLRLEKSKLKLQQLRDEKENTSSDPKPNEKSKNIGRKKISKVLDQKIRTKPSHKLERGKQNKNNPKRLPKRKFQSANQDNSQEKKTVKSQREIPRPEKRSKVRTAATPSRRERKRKSGEREERGERRFEELVRQYQKKLFRMNPN